MSDRVRQLRNESDESLVVKHVNGDTTILAPGNGLKDAEIDNLGEIRDKTSVTLDLGEIGEKTNSSGRTPLRD